MKRIAAILFICGLASCAFAQNFGIDVPTPAYKLHVYGQGHFSRDNTGECCSSGDFTLSLAENTAGTGKVASIQFHNSGVSEGYLRLANGGTRRIEFGSYQTTMAVEASGGFIHPDGSMQSTAKKIMWSGYCNYHGNAGGWNVFCNNSVDFNSASGYISANGSGTFTIQKSGYYRINFATISLGSGYAHVYLVINGTLRHYGHEYVHGAWSDNFLDWTWPMNAGETFYLQVHNPGSYAFHSGNANGQYNRIQVSYEGEL